MQVLWKSDTNNRFAGQGLQTGEISVCGIADNTQKTKIWFIKKK